jgi:hypothetical protein
MQKTKLLVIVITTTAIIAAATITTSLSAAKPAFAKRNCNETENTCSGGSGCGFAGCTAGTSPQDSPGGGGRRESSSGLSGGQGFNTDTEHGGFGIGGTGGGSGLNGVHPE